MKIEKAKLTDAKEIHKLISGYFKKGLLLYRPSVEIEHRIRDYFICRLDDKIVGCAALRVWNRKSTEIYALVVHPEHTGKKIGTKLIKACIADAKKLEVSAVFTLTFRHNLFLRAGFKKVGISQVPRIIFTEKTVDVDKAYGFKF